MKRKKSYGLLRKGEERKRRSLINLYTCRRSDVVVVVIAVEKIVVISSTCFSNTINYMANM